jgi:hypothetical protein
MITSAYFFEGNTKSSKAGFTNLAYCKINSYASVCDINNSHIEFKEIKSLRITLSISAKIHSISTLKIMSNIKMVHYPCSNMD